MKTILVNISISFILLWVLLSGLSRLYDFSLLHNYNLKTTHIQKSKIDAAILIHGPCQALWIVQPCVIEKHTRLKTYNLGLTHSDFADNYLHLYLYLKHNKAPKYLFLYISPESMDLHYNMFNTYRFASVVGDVIVDSVLKDCDSNYFTWTILPFMKYAYYNNVINYDALQGFKHFIAKKDRPYFIDGYEPHYSLSKEKNPETFIQIYPDSFRFEWNAMREKYLRKTIVLAQQHGVKVYLYESPLLKRSLHTLRNRNEMIYKIKAIANEYGIKFAQFEDMKMADSVKYYTSSVSMTTEGSLIFSNALGKYINNENLRK